MAGIFCDLWVTEGKARDTGLSLKFYQNKDVTVANDSDKLKKKNQKHKKIKNKIKKSKLHAAVPEDKCIYFLFLL